jgi:hypothetical protein
MAFMILFLNYHNIIVEQPHYFLFFGQQETLDQKNKDNIKICVSFLSREKSGLFLSGELNLITWPYDSPGHSTKRRPLRGREQPKGQLQSKSEEGTKLEILFWSWSPVTVTF